MSTLWTAEQIEKAMKDKFFRDERGKDWERVKNFKCFWNGYGAEEPKEILGWQWSYDHYRWSALVIFQDNQRCFAYPQK